MCTMSCVQLEHSLPKSGRKQALLKAKADALLIRQENVRHLIHVCIY